MVSRKCCYRSSSKKATLGVLGSISFYIEALNVKRLLFTIISLLSACAFQSLNAATLVGWAEMPMHTFSEGPTSGQFNSEGEINKNKQPIQGFSAVINSGQENRFYFLSDNGFGKKDNSADALLRLYEVDIQFANASNKNSKINVIRHVNFNDKNHQLGFSIQADNEHYNGLESNPKTDDLIRKNRLLTGADVDPESIALDGSQHLWVGDEFGPFLIELDSNATVINKAIHLPNILSPDSPYLAKNQPNINSSAGFEAMTINATKNKLYAILENSVNGDDEKQLRIYEFDLIKKQYADGYYTYKLEVDGTNVTDMVAINDHQFLVLERNTATTAKDNALKKVFMIDLLYSKFGDIVKKELVVDLMNLDDPNDLDNDGDKVYRFAYSHIEALSVLDKSTLLVANDNNFSGRTSFIKVKLDKPLALENTQTSVPETSTWSQTEQTKTLIDFGDHTFFGWMTVLAYLVTSIRLSLKTRLAWLNKDNFLFWICFTVLIVFLGFNKQLDLQSNFTEMMRDMAKANGWYEQRRPLQFLFVSFIALLLPLLFFWVRLSLANSWRRYKLMWIGILLLLVFIVIRAASFHHVDLIFYKTIGSLRFYQALEIVAISIIFVGTFFESKTVPLARTSEKTVNDVVEIKAEGETIACPKCFKRPLSEAKDGRVFKCKSCGHRYIVRLIDA